VPFPSIVTLAINRPAAVSPEPAFCAALPSAHTDRQSQGGFQGHLDESLHDDVHDSDYKGASASGIGRPISEKARKKGKDVLDTPVPVNLQEPAPGAKPLMIHLPGGSIVHLDLQPDAKAESLDHQDQADSAAAAELSMSLPAAGIGKLATEAIDVAGKAEASLAVPAPHVPTQDAKTVGSPASHGTGKAAADDPQGELAFAARVQPVTATAKAEAATVKLSGMPPNAEVMGRAFAEEKLRGGQKVSDPSSTISPKLTPYDAPPTLEASPVTMGHVENTTEVVRVDAAAENHAKAVTPLKDLAVQVGQSAEQKVEVRLAERGGELRLTVRTADTDLAHGLRQGIPEVVGRLSESGFRTETWHPGGSSGAVSAAVETASSSSDFQKQDSQGRGGAQHQEQQQRGQEDTNRPKWLEEFEGRYPNRENRGESNGFSN
jgi:hypothetical protein